MTRIIRHFLLKELFILITYPLDSVFDEFDNMEKTIEDSMRKIQESMKNEEREIELESAANPGNSNFKSYRNALKHESSITR